ncbi:MAG: hypothetical protein FWF02_11660 [Micrococcales bacterium]|nr:hypothetical protein [Micrococcales bacterium]MCL2668342.1 hypothetical protein [Micrococcales bacterium]
MGGWAHGGSHEQGFREAVTTVVARYAQNVGLREGNDGLSDDEVFQGLTAVVHVTMPDPQFAGPTKTCLDNPEAKMFVQKVVLERFGDWLDCHPAEAETITRHVVEVAAPAPAATQQAVLAVLTKADENKNHPYYYGTTLADVAQSSGLTASQARRALAALTAAGKVHTTTYHGDTQVDLSQVEPPWAYTYFLPRSDLS